MAVGPPTAPPHSRWSVWVFTRWNREAFGEGVGWPLGCGRGMGEGFGLAECRGIQGTFGGSLVE